MVIVNYFNLEEEVPRIAGHKVVLVDDHIEFGQYTITLEAMDFKIDVGLQFITLIDGVSVPVRQFKNAQEWVKKQLL